MSRPFLRGAAISLIAVLVLSACATSSGRSADYALAHTPAITDLTDTTCTADGIDDPDRDIVPGSTIRLTFDDDTLTANAGCNTLSGGASIDEDELVVSELASTLQSCEEPLMAQDEWLSSFLTSRPTIERQENDLWLSRDETVLHFVADGT